MHRWDSIQATDNIGTQISFLYDKNWKSEMKN